jgi:hypothetical protein
VSDLQGNSIAVTTATASTITVSNPNPSASIQVTQVGSAPVSTSTGGAVNVDNSLSTGAGIVVFSSHNSPSGRLIVGRATGAANAQSVGYFEQGGTGHALHANNVATNNATGSALNVTSTNTGNSAVFVSGVETGRGTVKITHTGTGSDAAAAAISIDLAGSGTAAQGIFMDATGGGTTGDLMDLRNNSVQLFKVKTNGYVAFGNGGPILAFGAGTPEGAVTAPVGSFYLNSTGTSANTTAYVKRTGTGNTGWFPVTA